MNVYDSEQMVNVLSPLGFEVTDDSDNADLVILNTCHIREKAAEKVYSELGRLKAVQRDKKAAGWNGPDQKLAVAGCVAQAKAMRFSSVRPALTWFLARKAITSCLKW